MLNTTSARLSLAHVRQQVRKNCQTFPIFSLQSSFVFKLLLGGPTYLDYHNLVVAALSQKWGSLSEIKKKFH